MSVRANQTGMSKTDRSEVIPKEVGDEATQLEKSVMSVSSKIESDAKEFYEDPVRQLDEREVKAKPEKDFESKQKADCEAKEEAFLGPPKKTDWVPGTSFDSYDANLLYDPSRNCIPSACFEIGAALSVLEKPGLAGTNMDGFAQKLSRMLDAVYNTDLGDKIVMHNGTEKPLRQVFNEKLLLEIKPSSDQIGRCRDARLDADWYNKGAGVDWLQKQLSLSSDDGSYTFENMLTKIRMLSAYGTVAREFMTSKPPQPKVLEALTGNTSEEISERYEAIATQLRHEGFDNPETRARSERPPIIHGEPLKGKERLQDASDHALGFGNVYVSDSFTAEEAELEQEYSQLLGKYGRGGMEREGQPIQDLKRPGNLSEDSFQRMPKAFHSLGLPKDLKEKELLHGTGVNRWHLHGTYPKQSMLNGLPSAGAHSGGTVDILLALDTLNPKTIRGNPEVVLPAGLLISAFMNFGAYHSFVETFPIAQAYAENSTFDVKVEVSSKRSNPLYDNYTRTVQAFSSKEASERVTKFREAHKESFREAKMPKLEVETLEDLDAPREIHKKAVDKDFIGLFSGDLAVSKR